MQEASDGHERTSPGYLLQLSSYATYYGVVYKALRQASK